MKIFNVYTPIRLWMLSVVLLGQLLLTGCDTGSGDEDEGDSDPILPVLSISRADPDVDEGDSGERHLIVFSINLNKAADNGDVTFDYATSHISTEDNDLTVINSTQGVIANGTDSANIEVFLTGDDDVETDETFRVDISNIINAMAGTTEATGTILNDDTAPALPSLTLSSPTAREDTGTITFTLKLSEAVQTPVTFTYSTANGSATAEEDYVGVTAITDQIGATLLSKDITIDLINDTEPEPDQTFTLTLSNVSATVAVANPTATGTITDDGDVAPTPNVHFTKLDANGNDRGDNALSWSCVRDNRTNLVWEVKMDDDGLQDKDWVYSWYDTQDDLFVGTKQPEVSGACFEPGNCNTQAYKIKIQDTRLCGFRDWRLPTRTELMSLVEYGLDAYPLIDQQYFPNTNSDFAYWTGIIADNNKVRAVSFRTGVSTRQKTRKGLSLRLVRGGQ